MTDKELTVAEPASDTTTADDAREQAEFGAGFEAEQPTRKPSAKSEKTEKPEKPAPAAIPRAREEPRPEYVQITAKEWADVRAAAARTASYDQQLSRLFGTTGKLQELVKGFQAQTPAGRKVEIPRDAFESMSRDFPELAQQTREALERALSGITGTGAGEPDTGKFESLLAQHNAKREIEALEDEFPDWRTVVGAVDVTREAPDPNNPFRKWLATKDVAYQTRINGSESAAVIGRAIRTFRRETAAPAKINGTQRNDVRADRIRAAVQPRGDGAGASAGGKTDDDEFLAGFNSR